MLLFKPFLQTVPSNSTFSRNLSPVPGMPVKLMFLKGDSITENGYCTVSADHVGTALSPLQAPSHPIIVIPCKVGAQSLSPSSRLGPKAQREAASCSGHTVSQLQNQDSASRLPSCAPHTHPLGSLISKLEEPVPLLLHLL